MKPEEIIPLFNKFYDQTINLDGLVLFLDEIHEGKNNSYDFYFKITLSSEACEVIFIMRFLGE